MSKSTVTRRCTKCGTTWTDYVNAVAVTCPSCDSVSWLKVNDDDGWTPADVQRLRDITEQIERDLDGLTSDDVAEFLAGVQTWRVVLRVLQGAMR